MLTDINSPCSINPNNSIWDTSKNHLKEKVSPELNWTRADPRFPQIQTLCVLKTVTSITETTVCDTVKRRNLDCNKCGTQTEMSGYLNVETLHFTESLVKNIDRWVITKASESICFKSAMKPTCVYECEAERLQSLTAAGGEHSGL